MSVIWAKFDLEYLHVDGWEWTQATKEKEDVDGQEEETENTDKEVNEGRKDVQSARQPSWKEPCEEPMMPDA